jgi:hypothetical protein
MSDGLRSNSCEKGNAIDIWDTRHLALAARGHDTRLMEAVRSSFLPERSPGMIAPIWRDADQISAGEKRTELAASGPMTDLRFAVVR